MNQSIRTTGGKKGPRGYEYPPSYGLIGGGQLGMLLAQETLATPLFLFDIYSPSQPLSQFSSWTKGDLLDTDEIIKWGQNLDVITIEIEDVSIDALRHLKSQGKTIIPDPDTLEIIKNKLTQKQWLLENNFPTTALLGDYDFNNGTEWDPRPNPCKEVHKLQTGGYDGRGVMISEPDNPRFFEGGPSFVEEWVDIDQEFSIIVGRSQSGQTITFEPTWLIPDPETKMLDTLVCPARFTNPATGMLPDTLNFNKIRELAIQIANRLNHVGLLAIEIFLTKDFRILVNEMSPRPHNSGHHTIEHYNISQNGILRQILKNIPLTQPEPKTTNPTILTNIIGKSNKIGTRQTIFNHPSYKLHYYGKTPNRPGRKMGHITFTDVNVPLEELNINSVRVIAQRMKRSVQIEPIDSPPEVAVIMGSNSDLPTMTPAIEILRDFAVAHQVKVVSAHRTPHAMLEFAKTARSKGFKVIIAAAGGAAHLPGMVASATTLPVIGVPVNSSNSIRGIDSLLSINQMPSGIPVGTMAINGSMNAALYAIRMLAIDNPTYQESLDIYATILEEKVHNQNNDLNI
jgi:phosphoribosylaminoimidazole carboxylase